MGTYHIHINGIVQGVGFRPLVYQLAREMHLEGYVKNGNDGVHIFFNASVRDASLFFTRIRQSAPAQSEIISSILASSEETPFSGFSILVGEENSPAKQVLLTPDVAICASCKSELHDTTDRRYRYPFITCTHCGPRYSIINDLPYERHNTSMQRFSMCKDCSSEYEDIENRRFFSQTNSCSDCGIKLSLWKSAFPEMTGNSEEILLYIKNFLREGKILAVKGIGGYLLLCDAANIRSLQLLRNRKHRPSKPFAVLYPDIETVRNDFLLNKQEEEALLSAEAPIVLLYPNNAAYNKLAVNEIAPGLKRIGVMLPYSPLLELIAGDHTSPLIATSANISGSPIVYDDKDAQEHLFEFADYLISYNRDIVVPQDDSVIQFSKRSRLPVILRRSRGYAPSFTGYRPKMAGTVISTGAFLKSSFTLSVNGNLFISQFLGSGENYEAQQMYSNTLEYWIKLYALRPDFVIADKHPGYFSHQYAIELAKRYSAHIRFVQHHEAHFASVLAENDLLNTGDPVLGVIWDGTGFGNDGHIWGGEFFRYDARKMTRCCHFDYFPVIAGDKQAIEPRIAALCIAKDMLPQPEGLKEKFTGIEWSNYRSMMMATKLFSSSAGRVFDAVASLIGICDKQTYEGEAAMRLQALAETYVDSNGMVMEESYFTDDFYGVRIPLAPLVNGIIHDFREGRTPAYIAAKFHYSLVCLVDGVAYHTGLKSICFSGGVFQNALLVDWMNKELGDKYALYFHRRLSPNDENISFGQMMYLDNNISSGNGDNLMDKINETDLKIAGQVEYPGG